MVTARPTRAPFPLHAPSLFKEYALNTSRYRRLEHLRAQFGTGPGETSDFGVGMQLEMDMMADELISRLQPHMPSSDSSDWALKIKENSRNVETVMGIIESELGGKA